MRLSPLLNLLIRRKSQLALFSGLTGICLIATVVLTAQVFLRLNDYAGASKDNVPWTVSRLEVAQLKLLTAVNALDPSDPDSAELVARRFDALYSQKTTVREGRAYQDLNNIPEIKSALAQIEDDVLLIGRIIDDGPSEIYARRDVLEASILAMSVPLRALATHGIAISAQNSDAERRALSSKLVQVTVLSLVLLVAILSLTFLLWQLFKLYRNRALENRQTLHRLETILNTSQDAVLVVCPDGCIIDTNAAAHHMFFDGEPPTEKPVIQDYLRRKDEHGNLTAVDGARLLKSCESGPNLCDNLIARNSAGETFPIEISNDRATRSGHPVVVCFIRNISRRAADQAALLAARDLALSGEKAKARFLSMISHDMRTPLNGVIGTLDLLEQTELTSEQARYIEIMQKSGQLLRTQIDDALELAQTDQGRLTLNEEVFDLDDLISQLVQTQMAFAAQQGNTLVYVPALQPLGLVRGDSARIHQILLNLIANAIKFTENGDITIEAVRHDQGGEIVEFQVADTGIGIGTEDQTRIFEDFVRLEKNPRDAVEGSGLGLGIVRHLTQLMGGETGVESEPGEGSLFWVRLPLPRSASPGSVAGLQTPRRASQSLDILVVDDNRINRTVLAEMLQREGHKVYYAEDGAEGVEHAARKRFDLIFMDLNMPVMDGAEAARQIRQGSGASADSRIVALTAHVGPDSKGRLAASGLDELLTKPLRLSTLRELLSGARAPGLETAIPNSKPLDLRMLEQLQTVLSDEKLAALCAAFKSEVRALGADLPELRAAPQTELKERLHELAGLAATIGATDLQQRLNYAESALCAGNDQEAAQHLDRLPAVMEVTLKQLDTLRQAA